MEARNVPASGRDGGEEPLRPVLREAWWHAPPITIPLVPAFAAQSRAPLCAHLGAPPPLEQGSLDVVPTLSPRPVTFVGTRQGPPQLPREDVVGQWHSGTIGGS